MDPDTGHPVELVRASGVTWRFEREGIAFETEHYIYTSEVFDLKPTRVVFVVCLSYV
jgi:hypothetical protein